MDYQTKKEILGAIQRAREAIEEARSGIADDNGSDAEVLLLARQFCRMDDDHQAKFFVEVARIMDSWGPGKRNQQAWFIGNHLQTCECSTDESRELVSMIAETANGVTK